MVEGGVEDAWRLQGCAGKWRERDVGEQSHEWPGRSRKGAGAEMTLNWEPVEGCEEGHLGERARLFWHTLIIKFIQYTIASCRFASVKGAWLVTIRGPLIQKNGNDIPELQVFFKKSVSPLLCLQGQRGTLEAEYKYYSQAEAIRTEQFWLIWYAALGSFHATRGYNTKTASLFALWTMTFIVFAVTRSSRDFRGKLEK